MKKSFIKMHGLGNDFAIFDGRGDGFALEVEQIRGLSDRRMGIGFDQAVILCPDNYIRIYNPDGREIPCGNATRCVAMFLMRESGQDAVILKTKFGTLDCRRAGDKVCVDMGPARLGWKEIPLSREADTLALPIEEGALRAPVGVSMGNPHAVFFVPDAEAVALESLGPKIEFHPLFPEQANVEAVQVLSRDKIRMRVWERGTGITMACGTGACAAAVAAARRGLTGRKVEVVLDGGTLHIEWRESDGHVLMTGAVATSYTGEVEV